jgi:hypothetical protein
MIKWCFYFISSVTRMKLITNCTKCFSERRSFEAKQENSSFSPTPTDKPATSRGHSLHAGESDDGGRLA